MGLLPLKPGQPRAEWLRRHRFAVAGSLLLAVGLGWTLHAGAQPVLPDAASLAAVAWPAIAALVFITYVVQMGFAVLLAALALVAGARRGAGGRAGR